MTKAICAFAALAMLCGCAYPTSSIQQGVRTELYVPHAPADARLAVDGKAMGPTTSSNGKALSYQVEPGTHTVLITGSNGPLLQKSVYVGAGSRLAVELAQ